MEGEWLAEQSGAELSLDSPISLALRTLKYKSSARLQLWSVEFFLCWRLDQKHLNLRTAYNKIASTYDTFVDEQ